MLKAYVRRLSGQTTVVQWHHSGQHLGVHDGAVRLARLYWDQRNIDPSQQSSLDELLSAVPLLDTLILTRDDPRHGQRVVFHGLITECGTDGATVSMIAADNPKADRLFDQPFSLAGPLLPTDQAPEPPFQSPPPSPQAVPGVPGNPSVPVSMAAFPPGVRALSQVPNPAARPGGHPAGHPQGAAPAPTGWVPSGRAGTQ